MAHCIHHHHPVFHYPFGLSLSLSKVLSVSLSPDPLSPTRYTHWSDSPANMDSRDNKMAAISTGDEGHEVHLCRRCGWPFPKPHPSAKHRRAHKKLCGTIEGYKIIHSEVHVSGDDNSSDEDEHTPSSPKVVKKTAEDFGSIGGVGARSNKSEDDVFSDAVAEFSDSGISPHWEDRFEGVREIDKILEQKSLEAHQNGNKSMNTDNIADTTEQVHDQTKSGEGASVCLVTGLQTDLVESEILRDNKSEYGDGESQEGQTTDESAPITLELEEVRISDQTGKKEELCDKLVSDQTEKPLQNSESSARISGPVKTVCGIAHSKETRDNNDAYMAVNISPEESLLSTPSVESDGLTEQSEAKPVVSSIEIKVNGNQNLEESKDSYSVDEVLIQPGSVVEIESKDVNQSDEKSGCEISGTAEKVKGSPVGLTMPSNDSTDSLSSHEAADLLERSKTESSPLEPRNNVTDKENFEQPGSIYSDIGDTSELEDNVEAASSEGTAEQQKSEEPNCAAQAYAELNNHNGDGENSEESNPSGQEEALLVKEGLNETSLDVEDVIPPLDVRKDSNEFCAANRVVSVDDNLIFDSEYLQAEVDEKLDPQEVGAAAVDLSANNSSSRADSLEANCGSVSDALEIDSQKPKATTLVALAPPEKSDTFEAPSFMTLVQSIGEDNNDQGSAVSEIETVKNNQQRAKSDAPEAVWFPSLTNVLNESEGRKKNEEIIAKVTKWSPLQKHRPLKNLLNGVKSPDTEKVKDHETDDSKDDAAAAVVVGPSDQKDAQAKDVEQWNSPASYSIEIKKEMKKKGRSLWVPFVCCSSVHRDL